MSRIRCVISTWKLIWQWQWVEWLSINPSPSRHSPTASIFPFPSMTTLKQQEDPSTRVLSAISDGFKRSPGFEFLISWYRGNTGPGPRTQLAISHTFFAQCLPYRLTHRFYKIKSIWISPLIYLHEIFQPKFSKIVTRKLKFRYCEPMWTKADHFGCQLVVIRFASEESWTIDWYLVDRYDRRHSISNCYSKNPKMCNTTTKTREHLWQRLTHPCRVFISHFDAGVLV